MATGAVFQPRHDPTTEDDDARRRMRRFVQVGVIPTKRRRARLRWLYYVIGVIGALASLAIVPVLILLFY